MKMELTFILAFLLAVGVSHASLVIQDANGTAIDSLTVQTMGNNTAAANFTVCSVGENSSLIKILYFGKFTITFSNSTLTNMTDGQCVPIMINESVPFNTTSQDYLDLIGIISPTDFKQLVFRTTILESKVWSVSPTNLTATLHLTSAGKLADFVVSNDGNLEINYIINIIGNQNNILWLDTAPFKLAPFTKLTRPIYFVVGNVTPSNFSVNLSVMDASGNIKMFSINLTVWDDAPPVIENVSFSNETEVGDIATFNVEATDNKGILAAFIEIDGKTFNMTKSTSSVEAYYFIYRNNTLPKTSNFYISLFDGTTYTNYNGSFLVKPHSMIQASKTVSFGRVKALGSRTVQFGNIQQSGVNYRFVLDSLSVSNPNVTLTLRVNNRIIAAGLPIVISDAAPLTISIQENQIENVTTAEDYWIDFNGQLSTSTDANITNPAPVINFFGKFDKYDVTPAETIDVPVIENYQLKTRPLACAPNDVGNYENSSYDCRISYPIDIGGEMKIISTVESYSALKEGFIRNATSLQAQRDAAGFWEVVFLFILIIFALGGLFYKYSYKDMHRH